MLISSTSFNLLPIAIFREQTDGFYSSLELELLFRIYRHETGPCGERKMSNGCTNYILPTLFILIFKYHSSCSYSTDGALLTRTFLSSLTVQVQCKGTTYVKIDYQIRTVVNLWGSPLGLEDSLINHVDDFTGKIPLISLINFSPFISFYIYFIGSSICWEDSLMSMISPGKFRWCLESFFIFPFYYYLFFDLIFRFIIMILPGKFRWCLVWNQFLFFPFYWQFIKFRRFTYVQRFYRE